MEKPAITSQPIHHLIQRRWSPRALSGEPIERETLTKLLEAARWAASRNNLQPWRFIVATNDNKVEFARLFDCLLPGNQKWAHSASALVAVVASLVGNPDRPPTQAFLYDTGLAVGQMVIEAQANGIYAHQMAGIDREKIFATYNIPENHEVVCVIALGTMGDVDTLVEPFNEREVAPRERKPLSEIAFSGRWGEAY
jgi:nitroreductase